MVGGGIRGGLEGCEEDEEGKRECEREVRAACVPTVAPVASLKSPRHLLSSQCQSPLSLAASKL